MSNLCQIIRHFPSEFLYLQKYIPELLENQFIYPTPKGSKLIFFAPVGDGVNEENQFAFKA